MDGPLQKVMADVKELDSELLDDKSTVRGVVCADGDGLCIAEDGQVAERTSALATSVAKLADSLEPENHERPVIVLEYTDKTQLIIKSDRDVTVAILKAQTSLPA